MSDTYLSVKGDSDTYPPVKGAETDWYDGRYRIWTVEHVPYGSFPGYNGGGPGMCTHAEWSVSFPRLCRALSSPSVVAADHGMIELSVGRVVEEAGGWNIVKHPLDGTLHGAEDDARRVAYEAGVIAYMVDVRDEAKYGF